MMRAAFTFLAVLLTAEAVSAQALGRFFFTPTERAQLDVARMQRKPAAPPPSASEPPPEPPPVPQTVTYGGIIRRSDGKAMLWINNRLVEEKEALKGLNLRGRVGADGAVTLQVPQTGNSINVKVGQSVEVLTGRVAETRPDPAKDAKDKDAKAQPDDGKSAAAKPEVDAKGAPAAAKPQSARAPEPPGAAPRRDEPQDTRAAPAGNLSK